MKSYKSFLPIVIFFSFSSVSWGLPLDELQQNEELFIESDDVDISLEKTFPRQEKSFLSSNQTKSDDAFLIQNTFLKKESGQPVSTKENAAIGSDESEFYLFEQEELDAQKPGLEIYQSLAPMLTPEMKKDAKKVWAETADFREAIDFSTNSSDSKELILQQSSKEMTLLKGKSLEELANKNLPPALYDEKEPDKAMVRELFDGIYDLLKNALLIIAGVLIAGKLISFIVKKVLAGSEKRKKRKAKRHSKRRRKKRRQTFA